MDIKDIMDFMELIDITNIFYRFLIPIKWLQGGQMKGAPDHPEQSFFWGGW